MAPKLNESTAEDVSNFCHLINDIARIGDHAKKILDDSVEMRYKKIKFDSDEVKEIQEIKGVCDKIFDLTIKIFENNTLKDMTNFNDLFEKSKDLQKEADQKHFDRLQHKKWSMELGSYYISTFSHFESIISHLENIIDFSGKESKRTSFNTFEGRDYIMVINQNNKKKTDESTTNRKLNTNENENSINNISEKINKSFG